MYWRGYGLDDPWFETRKSERFSLDVVEYKIIFSPCLYSNPESSDESSSSPPLGHSNVCCCFVHKFLLRIHYSDGSMQDPRFKIDSSPFPHWVSHFMSRSFVPRSCRREWHVSNHEGRPSAVFCSLLLLSPPFVWSILFRTLFSSDLNACCPLCKKAGFYKR